VTSSRTATTDSRRNPQQLRYAWRPTDTPPVWAAVSLAQSSVDVGRVAPLGLRSTHLATAATIDANGLNPALVGRTVTGTPG
jgi:hypothetical protein